MNGFLKGFMAGCLVAGILIGMGWGAQAVSSGDRAKLILLQAAMRTQQGFAVGTGVITEEAAKLVPAFNGFGEITTDRFNALDFPVSSVTTLSEQLRNEALGLSLGACFNMLK